MDILQVVDLPTAIFGLAIIILLPVVVYFISVFGMQGKSYEEAMAEQRRRNEAIIANINKTSDKGLSTKDGKRNRKSTGGRKIKDKVDDGQLHVEFSLETEIIPEEDGGETKTALAAKAARKSEEPKSILVRKEKEKSPSVSREPKSSSGKSDAVARENKEKTPPRRDDAERKSARKDETERKTWKKEEASEKRRDASKEKAKEAKSSQRHEELSFDESEGEEESPEDVPFVDKLLLSAATEEAFSAQRLMTLLNEAVLSHSEIHDLIELLLNRQHSNRSEDTEWLKPGQKMDPLSALKKQLEERDESLAEEKARSTVTATKLRELRQEITAEKTRHTHLGQALKEKQQELQELQARLQRSTADANALQTKLGQLKSKFEEEHLLAVSKLKEENRQMRELVLQLESKVDGGEHAKTELCSTIAQLEANLDLAQTESKQWQSENHRLQALLKNLEVAKFEEAAVYKQRISELSAQLHNIEQEKLTIATELNGVRSNCGILESERTSVLQKLSDAQAFSSAQDVLIEELKHRGSDLDRQVVCLRAQLQDVASSLMILKDDNESLSLQLSQLSERQEAEGRESGADGIVEEKTNGHVQENGNEKKILLSEHESILYEKEKLVGQLTAELKEKSRQVHELLGDANMSKQQIVHLKNDVDTQKKKNDELREKNWKVMEALNESEKSARQKIKEVELVFNERLCNAQLAEQQLSRNVLERIFPTVKIEKDLPFAKWITCFEEQARISLEGEFAKTRSDADVVIRDLQSKLGASESSCGTLRTEVEHYQTVLAETEGILNKLQSSVETEELQWKEKMNGKEMLIEKLQEEKKVLIDNLEEVKGAQQTVAEMESKLEMLKRDLNEFDEVDVKRLVEERDQACQLSTNVGQQLSEAKAHAENLERERDSLLERLRFLESVADEMEEEKRINRELNADIVKLSGQLKIGVAALKAEQVLVSELRTKLDAIETPSTNGPPVEDSQGTLESESRSSGVDSGFWPESHSRPSDTTAHSSQLSYSPAAATNDSSSSSFKKSKSRKRGVLAKK